jgi:hypothetical protein
MSPGLAIRTSAARPVVKWRDADAGLTHVAPPDRSATIGKVRHIVRASPDRAGERLPSQIEHASDAAGRRSAVFSDRRDRLWFFREAFRPFCGIGG